jgi:hypothetical protein
LNPDTDGDGLRDGEEVEVYQSNPLLLDTDGDGVFDGVEVRHANLGFDPMVDSSALLLSIQSAAADLPGVLTESHSWHAKPRGGALHPSDGGGFSVEFVVEEPDGLSAWLQVDSVSYSLKGSGSKRFVRVRAVQE